MNTVQTLESVPQLFRLGDVFFLQSKNVDIHDDNNNDDGNGHDDVEVNTKGSHH